jgi:hypothetical protein
LLTKISLIFNNFISVFSQGLSAIVSLAMELLKPKSGELPRAEQKDCKKQPVHPGGSIAVLKHATRG